MIDILSSGMRSDTDLTLLEYGEWLGADLYQLAGFEISDMTDQTDKRCRPVLERSEQIPINDMSGACLSRQYLRNQMMAVEQRVAGWTKRRFAPTSVLGEEHQFIRFYNPDNTHSYLLPRWKTVRDRDWEFTFGTHTLSLVMTGVTVDMNLDSGVPSSTFTLANVSIPDDTQVGELKVYLTATDAGYSGTPTRHYEIRPLQVTIDSSGGTGNWTATFRGHAVLFTKPSLHAGRRVTYLENEVATFVETVDIYRQTIDTTTPGRYVFWGGDEPCPDQDPCVTEYDEFCVTYRPHRGNDWVWTFPQRSDGTKYCLNRVPDALEFNYVHGAQLRDGSYMQPEYVHGLSMLMSAAMSCEYPNCCNPCATARWEHYNGYSQFLVEEPRQLSSTSAAMTGGKYRLVPSNRLVDGLSLYGLEPRRGNIDGLAFFRSIIPVQLSAMR